MGAACKRKCQRASRAAACTVGALSERHRLSTHIFVMFILPSLTPTGRAGSMNPPPLEGTRATQTSHDTTTSLFLHMRGFASGQRGCRRE